MNGASGLLQQSLDDLGTLTGQYAQLASMSVRDGARTVAMTALRVMIAGGLLVIATAELAFALGVWLVQRSEIVMARTALAAGVVTLLAALLCAWSAARALQALGADS